MQNGMTYMVRPRMHPRYSSVIIAFISAGSHQLLVTPASDSSNEQMKVRSSTRATSLGVGCGPERVRLRREPDERARLDEAGRHPFPLLLGPVAPHDPVRRGQLRHLAHPGQEARVLGRGVVYPWHGRCGHVEMPPTLIGYADPTSGTLRAPAPGRAGERWVGVPKPYLRPPRPCTARNCRLTHRTDEEIDSVSLVPPLSGDRHGRSGGSGHLPVRVTDSCPLRVLHGNATLSGRTVRRRPGESEGERWVRTDDRYR